MNFDDTSRPPPINVLPMVNKALALYQWKQDVSAAARLCEEALVIDPECDAAIATLAQLYLQNSRLDDAIDMFERHAKIARTGPELEQCFTFESVSASLFCLPLPRKVLMRMMFVGDEGAEGVREELSYPGEGVGADGQGDGGHAADELSGCVECGS